MHGIAAGRVRANMHWAPSADERPGSGTGFLLSLFDATGSPGTAPRKMLGTGAKAVHKADQVGEAGKFDLPFPSPSRDTPDSSPSKTVGKTNDAPGLDVPRKST